MNKKYVGIIAVVIVVLAGAVSAGILLPRIFYTDVESIENSVPETAVDTEKPDAELEDLSGPTELEDSALESELENMAEQKPLIPNTPFENEEVYYGGVYQLDTDYDISSGKIYGFGNKTYQMYEYFDCTQIGVLDWYTGTRDGRYLFYEYSNSIWDDDGNIIGNEGGIQVKSYDNQIDKKILDIAGNGSYSAYVFDNQYLVVYGDGETGEGWYLYDVLQPDAITWMGTGRLGRSNSIAAGKGNGFTFLKEDGLYYLEVGADGEPRKLAEGTCTYSYVKEDDLSVITYIQDGGAYCIFNQQMPIYYGSAEKVIYADENIVVCDTGIYRNGEYYTFENTYQFIGTLGQYIAEFVAYDKAINLAYLKVIGRNDYLEWTEIIGCYFDKDGNAVMESITGYPGYLNDSGQVLIAENGWLYSAGKTEYMEEDISGDPVYIEVQMFDIEHFDQDLLMWTPVEFQNDGEIGFYSNEGHYIFEKGDIEKIVPLSEGSAILGCRVVIDEQNGSYYIVYKTIYIDSESNTKKETAIESDFFKYTHSVEDCLKIDDNKYLVSGSNTFEIVDNTGNVLKILYESEIEWMSSIENQTGMAGIFLNYWNL